MDEHKLISLVQSKEFIYNKTSALFKNAHKKNEAWYEIAKEMGSTPEICQRRWTSLRERYCKALRQADAASGSGDSNTADWVHFDKMSFLRRHLRKRKQDSNFFREEALVSPTMTASMQDPIDETLSEVEFSPFSPFPMVKGKLEQSFFTAVSSNLAAATKTFKEYVESQKVVTTTPAQKKAKAFAELVETSLSTMGHRRQVRTITKLMLVLQDAELESDN